ncbi:MAG: DUF3089 domain-containing protein [Hyphomonadaceae bacterium]|nr:DUF3089 domain-containing protein [Hyphomonadaceae bacterium]
MSRQRRVLLRSVVLVLGLFVVALAASAWFGRDNLFRYLIQPQTPFQVQQPPAAPDYASPGAWAARPLDGSGAVPAVFFVHPNSSWTPRNWNVAIDDTDAAQVLQQDILPNHAGPFARAGRLWAPRYRQATLFALLAGRPDTRDALDLAYGDVAQAFQQFLDARPAGAPWILVGSGQGGQHVARLLADAVVGTPAAQGLAAVYVLEQAIGGAMLAESGVLAGLPVCAKPSQTGCLVTFVSVDEGDARGISFARERARRMHARIGIAEADDQPVCVNPLTGTADAVSPASTNRGAASASGLEPGVRPAMLPGQTGAACVDGLLQVDPDRPPALRPDRLDIGAHHKPALYNLFWQALEDDSIRRMAAIGGRPE